MKKFILKAFLTSSLIATSALASEVIEHTKEVRIHSIPLHVVDSRNPIGYLNSQAIFLSDQLERNLDKKYIANPVLVTSFVNLDNLNETNGLGRLLSESLIHQLHVKKWKIIDARLANNIVINENGEFALSRDIKNIKKNYNVSGIVTGTYTATDVGIVVNAKVMDIDSGVITSSGQIVIPTQGLESLLFNYSTARRTVKAKGSFD